MDNRPPSSARRRVKKSAPPAASRPVVRDRLPAADLARWAAAWLFDAEADGALPRTLESYRLVTDKLVWWLRREGHAGVGADELRAFQIYVRTAHTLPEGRWGEQSEAGRDSRFSKPVSPRTVANYHRWLRTFFAWLVRQKVLTASPFEMLDTPLHRPGQVQPFSEEQVLALLAAARRSFAAKRDTALVLILLDTGVRPLFLSESRHTPGEALTRRGLQDVIDRLGKAAGITGVRCSPHTFRHTHAVMFLRNGGSQMALMDNLGHTNLEMTRRYVAFTGADRANQVRQFSPVAGLKKKS